MVMAHHYRCAGAPNILLVATNSDGQGVPTSGKLRGKCQPRISNSSFKDRTQSFEYNIGPSFQRRSPIPMAIRYINNVLSSRWMHDGQVTHHMRVKSEDEICGNKAVDVAISRHSGVYVYSPWVLVAYTQREQT